MKKPLILIISLLITLNVSFAAWSPHASADVLEVCKFTELTDYLKNKAPEALEKALKDPKNTSNNLEIRVAFENARTKYHDTVKCVFDASTITMLGSAAGVSDNLKKDDFPLMTKEVLSDLQKPDKACLSDTKLTKIIKDNSTEILIPGLLTANNLYSDFIGILLGKLDDYEDNSLANGSDLLGDIQRLGQLKLILSNEVQDSIVALDSAFLSLKEMRVSFLMHVQFQCMLKNLEAFRKMLGNLRSVITTLPSVIEDASMHK